MSPVRFPVQPRGFSLLEVLLVTSIVATLAAVSIPVTAGALDELRTSMAARYLEGRIMNARATAVKRSTRIGLRFEPVENDCRISEYGDGNGNGVRASEIAAGLDPEIGQAEFIGGLFPGVGFGLHTGVPDVDGSFSTGSDVSGSAPAGYSRSGPTAQRPPEPSMSGGAEDSTRSGSWGSRDAPGCCGFIPEPGNGPRPDRPAGGSAAPVGRAAHAAGDAPSRVPGRRDRPELTGHPGAEPAAAPDRAAACSLAWSWETRRLRFPLLSCGASCGPCTPMKE